MAAAARGIPLSPYTGHLHWIRCPFQIVRHLEREKAGLVAGLSVSLSVETLWN